jgi:peptide/nickel transport system substrate-binding protein
MKKNKVTMVILLGTIMASHLLFAGGNKDPGTQTTFKDELRYAVGSAPETLDIGFGTSSVAQQITKGTVYETLVYQKDDYSIGLELAESYETNADASVYTYRLRKGVKFHNGQELKAYDAVASLNRWLTLYGSALTKGAVFKKVDDYTITIDLGHPLLYLNDLIATAENNSTIVPKSVVDKTDISRPITEYIGTGPYKFTEWATDRYILLTKYDDYVPYGTKGEYSGWGGYKEALTAKVYYYFASDENTRVAGLQTGEYDVLFGLPLTYYNQFRNDSQYTIRNRPGGDAALIFNKRQGIAANPKFRQAVQAGINDDDVMLGAYTNPEFFEVDSSYIISKDSDWYTKVGSEYYNVHDPVAVARLLREAGYNGEPFRLLVSQSGAFYNAGIVLEQELKQFGINIELIVQDWATYLTTRADASRWDAFITSFDVTILPPLILYLSPTWVGYADDPKLQNGLQEIAAATDKKAAIALWTELQRYSLAEYVPVAKFGNYSALSIANAKVEGGSYYISPHPWNVTVRN